jgi:DNA replication and repair protein RecF
VVVGGNGEGKTNLLEAIGYLATLSSFRGVPNDALVRAGCEQAVVRASGTRAERTLLIESEITRAGRGRVTVNRQPLRRTRDLLGAVRTSVFSPDDLALVKGAPSERRRYLDEALVSLHPRHDATRAELERVLRQRNSLLRQAAGRVSADVAVTLDVWDAKLAEVGEAWAALRAGLVERLAPRLADAYASLSGTRGHAVEARYEAPWRARGLGAALAAGRDDDVRRGTTLVGPHRDELALSLRGLPARTHASQGEQRALALSLRLAAHVLVTEDVGEPPVLLLDDVFSELDAARSAALVGHLPPGQAVLTTAGTVPERASPDVVVRIEAGRVLS